MCNRLSVDNLGPGRMLWRAGGLAAAAVALTLAAYSLAPCQAQAERTIGVSHTDARVLCEWFSPDRRPVTLDAETTEFLRRCQAAAYVALPAGEGQWQTFCESRPRLAREVVGSLNPDDLAAFAPLPSGLTGPPVAVDGRALRARGTAQAVARFAELVSLLDAPADPVSLRVRLLKVPPKLIESEGPLAGGHGLASKAQRLAALLAEEDRWSYAAATLYTRSHQQARFSMAELVLASPTAGGRPEGSVASYQAVLNVVIAPTTNADGSVQLVIQSQYLENSSSWGPDRPGGDSGGTSTGSRSSHETPAGQPLALHIDGTPSHDTQKPERPYRRPSEDALVLAITPVRPPQHFPDPLGGIDNTHRGPVGESLRAVISGIMRRAIEGGADGVLIGVPDDEATVVWVRAAGGKWQKQLALPSGLGTRIAGAIASFAGGRKEFQARGLGRGWKDSSVRIETVEGPEAKGMALTWARP